MDEAALSDKVRELINHGRVAEARLVIFDTLQPSFKDAIVALHQLGETARKPVGTGPMWRDALLAGIESGFNECRGAHKALMYWIVVARGRHVETAVPTLVELEGIAQRCRELGAQAAISKRVEVLAQVCRTAPDTLVSFWERLAAARSREDLAALDSRAMASYAQMTEHITEIVISRMVIEDPRPVR
jgi:hypothetical protein